MSKQENLVYFTMLFLALITAYSLYLPEQDADQPVVSSGLYERIIWTDKETYELGEPVEAAIVFVNHNEYPISINPIYSYEFSGNSVYDPEKVACGIFADYPAGAKIIVPAKGNLTLNSCTFTPTYPGPFKIIGLGLTKTVNVTGYKEVTLNSTGISLKIEANVPVLKDKENIEFSLVVVNDNPYPVKIPVFDKLEYGFLLGEITGGFYPDWAIPFFKVEAYSQTTMWRHSFRVSYPSFTLYIYVNDYTASLTMEVEK